MKITFSKIHFGNSYKNYAINSNKICEIYNDDGVLSRKIIYDSFDRDIQAITYDKEGNVTEEMYKTYTNDGYIENFKSKSLQYLRKCYSTIINNYKHEIEEYVSITNPKSNYLYEKIRNVQNNKLIKFICNGKTIL